MKLTRGKLLAAAEAARSSRTSGSGQILDKMFLAYRGLEAKIGGDATTDVTSAVRVARRRRTDMVMQASMWGLGVAAVERQLCRSDPQLCGTSCGLQLFVGHYAFQVPHPAQGRRVAART